MGKATIYQLNSGNQSNQLALKADRALAKLASSGDREAFKTIVDTHKQRMFTVARSVIEDAALAEDIVQEAFIKAYKALPDFRGQSRLSTWLHRITYLTAIDMSRQRSRHLRLATDEFEEDATLDGNNSSRSESQLESTQLHQQITKAMQCLSDFEQTVFTLRHMQNFKLREIALVVDRSEGTVKNILFRAIRKMRDQLAGAHIQLQEIERC
ncbi:MAG: sigma-70 family RNA polymerase sigma factor [Pseudomonadales bacterium]|nr:sigma-70 family RNA polymerase sigma factor [Pseudomonadales bacterium]